MLTKTRTLKTAIQTFQWRGKDGLGRPMRGEMEGTSIAAVKALLRSQEIAPTKVRKKPKPLWSNKKQISSRDTTVFTRQMATMLSSGIPLVQSFDVVAKGHPNPNMSKLITVIKKDVEEGKTFSQALEQHPAYFSSLYCSLIATGEHSGALDKILERLAKHKEKTESIKGKIKKALIYPAAVIVVALLVTAVILIYVIPQFEALFKGFGADLPYLTRMVISLSRATQKYWWVLLGLTAIASTVSVYAFKHIPKFKQLIDRVVLKIPVIGGVIRKASIARFSRTLATTFAAGVPLVDGLKTVAKSTGNYLYECATDQLSFEIARGQQLKIALKNVQIFPEMVVQMVAIGEESGELEQMLTKIADIYEEEVDNTVNNISTLIEPIIMVVLGVLVGGLIIAMYLPIFKLGSVI